MRLGAEAVVRVKAACSNWRLPTPTLPQARPERGRIARCHATSSERTEGATMRVSGSQLQLKLDLTGLPQELRKRARRISAAP